ncbi:RNA polymerase sigma factor [bacterium]|nr:RNA polymerase sigma factor [bacterium]
MALSDVPAELVERCQKGDSDAFSDLFEMIRDDLFRWAYSLLRNEDDALEVVQECSIRIFRHLERLKDPKRFSAWVGRMLVNQVNTYRVKAARTRTESLEDGLEAPEESLPIQGTPGAGPRAAASRNEVYRDVNAAIQELPPRQRTAVLLFDVKGWSIKEVAAELGTTEGAVKFNIFQGRRKLRQLLDGYVNEKGELNVEDFD